MLIFIYFRCFPLNTILENPFNLHKRQQNIAVDSDTDSAGETAVSKLQRRLKRRSRHARTHDRSKIKSNENDASSLAVKRELLSANSSQSSSSSSDSSCSESVIILITEHFKTFY